MEKILVDEKEMKVFYDGSPKAVKERLMMTICIITRKPNCPHFFDLSIKRIGRQALSNRIGSILKCIDFDGHNLNLRNERIRVELKRTH